MAKKTVNIKSKKVSTKKNIDINDIDSVMEDMKNLALKKPKEELEVKQEKEIVEEDTKIKEEINNDTTKISEELEVKQEKEIVEEIKDEIKEEEDLSFVEEIKEEIIEQKNTEEKKTENKPKRISYEQMFGSTWCGYGFTYN